MQSRFRLPRSPDQVIALDTRRSALRFLAELLGLLSQALIYCNWLLEMSSLRHALLHLERGWSATGVLITAQKSPNDDQSLHLQNAMSSHF